MHRQRRKYCYRYQKLPAIYIGSIQRDTFLIGICIQYPERTLLLSFSLKIPVPVTILCAYGYSDVNVHLFIYAIRNLVFLCTKNFFLLSFSDITSLLLINICYFLNHICVLKKPLCVIYNIIVCSYHACFCRYHFILKAFTVFPQIDYPISVCYYFNIQKPYFTHISILMKRRCEIYAIRQYQN